MILSFSAIMAISATSCKKDWTCNCGGVKTTINGTKAQAKKSCEATVFGVSLSDCKLE